MEKEEELKAALRTFFNCAQVEPRVISGQMASDTVIAEIVSTGADHPAAHWKPRAVEFRSRFQEMQYCFRV